MKRVLLLISLVAVLVASAQSLETVNIDGKNRTMLVYKPDDLGQDRPLVISLHGANQDAAYQRDQTKWNNCADTANFVVVYPNAINKFWDVNGNSDISFLSQIIDLMYERFQIDLDRVYVSGFSLGAMMTYHCIEHLGNKVAAFAPVSGVRFDNKAPIAPRRVPIIHTHGTGDDVFKWLGDPGHAAGGYPYIPDYVESWAVYEDLSEKVVISPYPSSNPNSIASLTVWSSADPEDDIEVALLALKDKGHWHSEDIAAGVSTTQEIWKFCKRYSLQPMPPSVVSVQPEDMSFDLNPSDASFSFTLSDLTDIASISASLSSVDGSVSLVCPESENSQVVNFNVPEAISLAEGEYTLSLSGLKNPKGGDVKSVSFTYFFGRSDYGDRIKADFAALYDYAVSLYEGSDGATAMSVVNARNRLKKYIDKYADFASTAPSEYAKASDNLSKNFEILENYIESLGICSAFNDADVVDIRYFSIDGIEIASPCSGLSIQRVVLNNGTSLIHKIYR